jgi:L-galactonate 5-dehydrogenase
VTVEAIGLKQTFVAAVELTAFAGRVVYVGYVKDPVPFETKQFILKEIQIRGARNAVRQDFFDVLKALKDLDLPIDKLISKDVSLAEAGEAPRYWSENSAEITKILVSFE